MGKLKDILRLSGESASSEDIGEAVRNRAADALRPGHVWVAGRKLPAPSASSLMALCLFGSPFTSTKKTDLLETELPLHVATALYCLALRSESIPAAHAKDAAAVAQWADAELSGLDYLQAANDLMLAVSASARGFDLFSDDTQKKTTARPPSRSGGPSSGWLSRLLMRRPAER